ncbi:MAG: ATP-binding protein [Prevotella sp.]|jgi:nitrogen fixation/metabolism regulation signal transduction histidine kinase|nr:ATP-binding protein [Prevotella sp.]
MKKYYSGLIIRISLLVVISVGIGISFSMGSYWLGTILIMFGCWSVYFLFKFLRRTVKDMKRFISAIRFYEFNISFQGFEDKGLYPDLTSGFEDAIGKFNKKIQQIEADQSFYDILLNRVDSGLLVLDANKDIRWINKPALEILGKPQPHTLYDLYMSSPQLPSILENLAPRETRTVKVHNGKKEYSILITAVLLNIKGQQQKLISLKNIQTALEENESEAWKKLIKVLTHEMMNSIAPIISLSDTFSKENVKVEDNRMIYSAMQTIHRRSKGLVEFVNNYKKITHLPAPVYSQFRAKELMEDIKNLLTAEGIKFSTTIIPASIVLNADRNQLEQVMINLIKNAWQASSENENPKVQIEITLNEYQKPVITVSDNGYGIPEDLLDKIFIPFFTTKKDGSGIGLSICRQIINAHGGTISAQSEIDAGSRFFIRL